MSETKRIAVGSWIRQFHRWVAIVFTVTVIANFVVRAKGTPPPRVTYSPLLPLAVLPLTGLCLFVMPYTCEVAQREGSMKKASTGAGSASDLISKRTAEFSDWRGKTLSRMRKLIHEEDPDVVEEWKWMGTPIWSHDGIICTGESYKDKVKLTFAKGAMLKDPKRLFNSSLDGNVRRAIDILEGEEVDASAFRALVRQAVALNSSKTSKPSKKKESLSHESPD